jgi:hypothetical protein
VEWERGWDGVREGWMEGGGKRGRESKREKVRDGQRKITQTQTDGQERETEIEKMNGNAKRGGNKAPYGGRWRG